MNKFLKCMGIVFLSLIGVIVILYFVVLEVRVYNLEYKVTSIEEWSFDIVQAVNRNIVTLEKFFKGKSNVDNFNKEKIKLLNKEEYNDRSER